MMDEKSGVNQMIKAAILERFEPALVVSRSPKWMSTHEIREELVKELPGLAAFTIKRFSRVLRSCGFQFEMKMVGGKLMAGPWVSRVLQSKMKAQKRVGGSEDGALSP